MAGYCEYADLARLVPERDLIALTDDARSGSPNYEVADECIQAEADLIDGYIGKIHALPLAVVPPMIRRLNAQMALHRLHGRLRPPPEHLAKQYNGCIATLKAIVAGDISIGLQPVPDPPAETGIRGAAVGAARDAVFGASTMGKF